MELRSFSASLLAVLIVLVGCSGSGGVTSPGLPEDTSYPLLQNDNPVASRQLWGLWDVTIDVQSGEVELVPCRTAMMNINAVFFMQGPNQSPAIYFCILQTPIDEDHIEVDVDVSLVHPFEDYPEYSGFDVRGIVMSNATSIDCSNPRLRYSVDTEKGCVLTNPDGYTRWWNCPEFRGGDMPVLNYTPGVMGDIPYPTATLNPYKYFCDVLRPEDLLQEVAATEDFRQSRGITTAGNTVTRYYELYFPCIDGKYPVHFQYAVDASWAESEDWPPEANQPEPFHIASENPDRLTFRMQDWPIPLDIEVFSWQALDPDCEEIEIRSIALSSPDEDAGWPVDLKLEGDALDSARVIGSGCAVSSVWHVEIDDAKPVELGFVPYLVAVEPPDNYSYDQGYGQPAPRDPLNAYQICYLEVDAYAPSGFGPELIAYAYPLAAYPEYEIQFDACGSYDTRDYCWDWENDGIFDQIDPCNPTHTYSQLGIHKAMLLGLDGYLNEDWLDDPFEIIISDECIPPTAAAEPYYYSRFEWEWYPDLEIRAGDTLVLVAANTGGTGPMTWEWDWDDGNGYVDSTQNPWIEHEFNEAGIFDVMCRATNECGSDEIDEPLIVTVLE